jgi:hypothetical protein
VEATASGFAANGNPPICLIRTGTVSGAAAGHPAVRESVARAPKRYKRFWKKQKIFTWRAGNSKKNKASEVANLNNLALEIAPE